MLISDLKKGNAINWKHGVWIAQEVTFVNPGKGSAFYRIRLRNIETSQTVENTFKSGETLDEASVELKRAQYLYSTGSAYSFMEQENFETIELSAESLGDITKFLKESAEVDLLVVNGRPVGVKLPPKMTFQVTEAPPGVKGDSATGKVMPVTIETGATVMVPLFIKTGEMIRVNTETGDYVERAAS